MYCGVRTWLFRNRASTFMILLFEARRREEDDMISKWSWLCRKWSIKINCSGYIAIGALLTLFTILVLISRGSMASSSESFPLGLINPPWKKWCEQPQESKNSYMQLTNPASWFALRGSGQKFPLAQQQAGPFWKLPNWPLLLFGGTGTRPCWPLPSGSTPISSLQ